MELKVWVDGVVRVVCGLSEETSCQDVVIALAQAIGQTGRYVLIQRLRDTEKQLLANERPLESLAKLGQLGNEVQFFLRRTGPSSSDGPAQSRGPPLPKLSEPEPPKRREPKKSLTFNLGPTSSPQTKLKHFRKPHRDSPEPRASPPPPAAAAAAAAGPSKEEVFRKVLVQQERLQALEAQLEGLEQEVQVWEQPPALDPRHREELELLQEEARRNEAELALEEVLERELQAEAEAERRLRGRLGDLHAKMDDCSRRLRDFHSRSAQLERDIQQEARASSRPRTPTPDQQLGTVRVELQAQQHQGAELEASITEMEKALGEAEAVLQVKNEELDELNKELRQCNLQQFIQQTGALPSQSQARTDQPEQLEQPEQLDGYSNGGSLSYPSESPPRPTAKQFMGNPRNLQNPLISSLNPEVLTSREASWR
ncbi:ras association domain-containing protein 8 [Anguilla anguilla]|uniref:ras association domain-containing protein 8 n=1 Tax=Anguilla anguilla TaxID=7936 RepID=UPI0015AE58EA|nr:ras association domain-containing protein 8 [Anguilla anguilla]XP_035252474.1 ras association domain-containing protein 8 [Anguilla anguilla]XP_035252475.1 ras association domain-containing protein 8 [Anguilla anguilla]